MVGGGKDQFTEYFKCIEKYINGLRLITQNMGIVDNFATLFTMIANHEGSEDMTKDTIKRFI